VDLRRFLKVLAARWLLVAVVLAVAVAAAAAVAWTKTPEYEAHTQLFVSTRAVATHPAATYQGGLFAQERVVSYAQIVTSPQVLEPVIARLRLHATPKDLSRQISATVPANTVLLDITVRSTSAPAAAAIAREVAASFISFVARLEQPRSGQPSPVRVTVTEPAQVPTSASSPRKPLIMAVAVVLGLVLGIGAALLSEVVGRRAGDEHDLEAAAGAPILGVVSEGRRSTGLARLARHGKQRSESYLLLAAALRPVVETGALRSLVVSSPHGGAAAAPVAANLSVALAETGYSVACVEASFDSPRIAAMFDRRSSTGLADAVGGLAHLDAVAQPWGADGRLHVIDRGSEGADAATLFGSRQFGEAVRRLEERYEVVVISAPPLLDAADAALVARSVGGCLLVVRDDARIDDLSAAVHSLGLVHASLLGLVLNQGSRFGRSSSLRKPYATLTGPAGAPVRASSPGDAA
jgi:capsular polysaccharide biosynthesis protein